MKLLHVIGSMNPKTGGPCQMIRTFAPWFIGQGNSLDVVCLDAPDSGHVGGDPFPVYALGRGITSWNYHPALVPWLEKNLANYDAAILNGLWQFQGYALWKTSKRPKMPPFYLFPHGMLDPWFQKFSVYPFKSVRNWLLWKTAQHRVIHDAEALLFTCEEERRIGRNTFRPYAPKREAVVGLGLPEPPECRPEMKIAFFEKCPGLGNNGFFLFLSRIHPKKGVDLLVKAYANLCMSSGKQTVPNLVIAGPGLDTEYGQAMQKLASEICPANSVFWPGMLAGDSKWGALYHCDASVLPSHQENFGIAVVETLACGRPVLISDQVNIWREIKEDGAALVQPDTVEGTTRLFAEWTALSAEAKSKMAASSKPCFQRHFSIEGATRSLIEAMTFSAKPHECNCAK
jgi:glycosyltransferase involved in cell wall biosynthesis